MEENAASVAAPQGNVLYVFLDESGNLDFSPSGSRFFIYGGLSCFRPFGWYQDMVDLRYSLLERPHSLDIERFHATEDRQPTRDKVFALLQKHSSHFRFDAVVVEKAKANPAIQAPEKFFPKVLGWLLKYIVSGYPPQSIAEVIFVTDTLPVKRNKDAVTKGIKKNLADAFGSRVKYRILHWASASSMTLQAADYLNWAIYKKWTNGELRPYQTIQGSVRSEFDVFRRGTFKYYNH